MKIYIAEEAGFCFGVKRALRLIERLHERGQGIQVFGQLIHNQSVLNNLQKKGIGCTEKIENLDREKTLVIRTHGIPRDTENRLKGEGIAYVDATCPFVKKIHRIIKEIDTTRTLLLILGDESHPEVTAARSYARHALVIGSLEEAQQIKKRAAISVVAQTTLNADLFKEIISVLLEKADKLEVYNTICSATRVRQEAIKQLAPRVDLVVVVGSNISSNTRKLFEIAVERNRNTFLIEGSSDLMAPGFIKKINRFRSVAITAGASTPPEELERVKEFFKNLNPDNIVKEMNNGRSKRNSRH